MPRGSRKRYDTAKAKDFLYRHGFMVEDSWFYENMKKSIPLLDLINNKHVNLSLNDVEKMVNKKRNPRLEYDPQALDRLFNIGFQPGSLRDDDRFLGKDTANFINSHYNEDEATNLKLDIKTKLPQFIKRLKQAIKSDGTLIFDVNNDEDAVKQTALLAMQKLKPDLLKHNVNVILTSSEGQQK